MHRQRLLSLQLHENCWGIHGPKASEQLEQIGMSPKGRRAGPHNLGTWQRRPVATFYVYQREGQRACTPHGVLSDDPLPLTTFLQRLAAQRFLCVTG